MKKILLTLFLIVLTNSYAQVKYERGHYIDLNGNKIEGEVGEIFFELDQKEFSFKNKSNATAISLDNVSEIMIGGNVYQKKVFSFDPNAKLDFKKLSKSANYDEESKTDFLERLVYGKYSLYRYVFEGVPTFFYTINDGELVTLEYKKYLDDDSKIHENKSYVSQLRNNLPNPRYTTKEEYHKILYNSTDLVFYFSQLNGKNYVSEKKSAIKFNLFAGYAIHGFDLDFRQNFGTQTYSHFTVMPEVELIVDNYAKNPLSLYANIKYHKFEKEYIFNYERQDLYAQASYEALNFALGVKKYFLSTSKFSTYVKAGVGFNYVLNSAVEYTPIDLNKLAFVRLDAQTAGFNTGVGFKFMKNYSVELDYDRSFDTRYYKNNNSINFKVGHTF